MADIIKYAPFKEEDFIKELPDNWDDCMDLLMNTGVAMQKTTVHMFWFMGRIIDNMTHKSTDAIKLIMEQTGYKDRTLYYMLNTYRAFPDFNTVKELVDQGVSATAFKELARIKDDNDRKELAEKITDGEVSPENIYDEVNSLLGDKTSDDSGDTDTDTGDESGESEESGDTGESKSKKEGSSKGPDEYFTKLSTIFSDWRTDMKVDPVDISRKIDEINGEYKSDDQEMTDCKSAAGAALEEVNYSLEYFNQIKSILEDFIASGK